MSSTFLTIPNALSLLRLAGVPIYLYLISGESYLSAVVILVVAGATDYLDGKIARKFNQTSRIGELLDPAADRLYVVAILFSLWDLDLLPLLVVFLIVGRDIVLGLLLIVMKRYSIPPFKVTYLGKAATFNLLYAFPLLLLTIDTSNSVSSWAFSFGWAFSIWGVFLYLYTGVSYFREGIKSIQKAKAGEVAKRAIG